MKKTTDKLLNLAKEKISLKKFDESLEYLKEIIETDNNNLEALANIADIFFIKKNYLEAIKVFDNIIKINPKFFFIYNNKGTCLLALNKLEDAKLSFETAIMYKKDYVEAYNNLGIINYKIGNYDEAKNNYNIAIKYKNDYAEAYNNLGILELFLNNVDNALYNCKKSIEINFKYKEAYNNLGLIFKRKKKFDVSINNFNKALEIDPKYLDCLINLALINSEINNYKESYEYFEKVLIIDPNNIESLSGLIHLKLTICNWKGLSILKKKLFTIFNESSNKTIHPYYSLLLDDNCKFQKIISEKWSNKYQKKIFTKFNPYNNEKIKLGYFSSDFKDHAISTLVKNFFKNHNKQKFELYGFNISSNTMNTIDENITKHFTNFIDCGFKADEEILKICKDLKIDIAIDINGYTKSNRFRIFKQKCAPIQINYLGYPGTLGDKVVDYIVADKTLIPKKYIHHYSEKIIYLPDTYQPNAFENLNLENKLNKEEFNLPTDKFIFCCFNNSFKINEFIFNIWTEILKLSENSVLWLLSSNPFQNQNLINEFKKRGISISRLIFTNKIEYLKHLERFQLADLFLDTYPYGGHTTSIESLAAGLPILTFMGETFQSRVTASLLNNLNLSELITDNKDDYIKLAVDLSKNKEKIEKIKLKINEQKKMSNIFKNKIYTSNLEKAYMQIYENFVNKKELNNVYI